MSATIQIDREEFAPWRSSEMDGVNVETRPSAYDVPEEVGFKMAIEKGVEVTQLLFVYLTPERRLDHTPLPNGGVVTFGSNSRRIYVLTLKRAANSAPLSASDLVAIYGGMVDQWRTSDGRNRSAHYDLIKAVVADVLGKFDLEKARSGLQYK